MGSQVRFIRAPRGDAVQAPPPVGAQSQLGTSARAAREDHTHEGVHRLVAGEGLRTSPDTGLGDVTLAIRHWRAPVQSASDLPTSGNEPGDARVVIQERAVYVWTGSAWQKAAGSGGGGGGGGTGFDAWGALNRLHLGIEMVQAAGRPPLTALSERYDALVDDSAIDWTRSTNVEFLGGRIVAKRSTWVGFGDDWVRVARRAAKASRREAVASLAPGSFEAGLAGVLGAGGGFAEGVAGVLTRGPLITELATEAAPPAGVVAGGSFDAGPTPVVALLPKPAYPSRRITRTTVQVESRDVIVALSSGGMDYGPHAVIDPWGRASGFEAGLTGVIAARRESVQLAGGPSPEIADGSFEAGPARVILRPVRRGGAPVVVSKPIPLPGVPVWGYAVARGERVRVELSRDGGVTWTEAPATGAADLSVQGQGMELRARARLEDEARSYLEAWAYGAGR